MLVFRGVCALFVEDSLNVVAAVLRLKNKLGFTGFPVTESWWLYRWWFTVRIVKHTTNWDFVTSSTGWYLPKN